MRCTSATWRRAHGHHGRGCALVVTRGLGLGGKDAAARGRGPGRWRECAPTPSLFRQHLAGGHQPEWVLMGPWGQRAPWQPGCALTTDPHSHARPQVSHCPGDSSTTTGPPPHRPLIGSSLKVGGRAPRGGSVAHAALPLVWENTRATFCLLQ